MSEATAPSVDFFAPQTNACPYRAYAQLRDEAPAWQEPRTGMWFVTRYDDVRAILLDKERFRNGIAGASTRRERVVHPERAERLQRLYQEEGWVPAPTLNARDEPEHMELRRLFDHAFRPAAIKALDPLVERYAHRLLDRILAGTRCEWVSAFAVPLPLYVIGHQVGVPEEDLPRIKAWTDAWVKRMGLMQTEEEALWSARMEIEAQHYFQPRIERLRREPDDSLLSVLVNREIPEWGRTLTNEELHAELMSDLFVGGSETTTNALAAGVLLLARNPVAWERLKADPGSLEPFCEEVLRLESPVQGLLRITATDVELGGVTIPAGSVVMLRYGAANRDERQFERPDELDLDRNKPRRHLAFGVGRHHCLGAPLARRELYFGFKALVERVDELWLLEGNELPYQQNFFLRALGELHVGVRPA